MYSDNDKVMFRMRAMLAVVVLTMLPAVAAAATGDTFDHTHSAFTRVLSQHVSDGMVDYSALKDDPSGLLSYLELLAAIDPADYETWNEDQKLAMWINAYNAYTLKAIIDNYPISHSWLADPLGHYPDSSIRQLKGVWDDMTWRVMGRDLTLNHMEHEIMRKQFVEPRVHYVLVCASIGCPWLEPRAFAADDLDRRLEQAGRDYIYLSRRTRIDRENAVVSLPQIYKWFEEDFVDGTQHKSLFEGRPAGEAGILSWVYRFADEADREFLANNEFRVVYLFYDWGLNEKR